MRVLGGEDTPPPKGAPLDGWFGVRKTARVRVMH